MAVKIKSTRDIHLNGVKIMVYGSAGSGKTKLCSTLPAPIIISSEGGMLSLSGYDLPYIEVSNMMDLQDAYRWVTESSEANDFESIALDSLSEIAEVVLANELSATSNGKKPDGRLAYGEMASKMAQITRGFRDISGKHVYISAKLEKAQDEMGRVLYSPSMPGKQLGQQMPYFFDEVFAIRVEKDQEGVTQRWLMCETDGLWVAKDRSGKLSPFEEPNLGGIIKKISEN